MVRKLKYQLIKMKNSEEININQIKRFSMPVLFTGAVNFFVVDWELMHQHQGV